MGTAASVDSPKVQEGVAFPQQDGDMLAELKPGITKIKKEIF